MAYVPPSKRNTEQSISRSSTQETNRRNIFTSNHNVDVNESPRYETQSTSNCFKTNKNAEPVPVPVPTIDINEKNIEELFPTLGETKENDECENKMNFAKSLFYTEPKEEKTVKTVKDGWVLIQKRGKKPRFILGDKSKEQKEFEEYLEIMEAYRLESLYNKILDRYEEYEENDLFMYGPKYIQSWEVNDYIKELQAEKKRNNAYSSGDDSSDDDNSNEFN